MFKTEEVRASRECRPLMTTSLRTLLCQPLTMIYTSLPIKVGFILSRDIRFPRLQELQEELQ